MPLTLTKYFHFSASHQSGARITGHNYVLGVTTRGLDEPSENVFVRSVEESLIRHLESRDLGLHVPFLQGVEINDSNLLQVFWRVLKDAVAPQPLLALTLKRDNRTETVYTET